MWNDAGDADNLEPDERALEAARMEAQVWGRAAAGPNGEGETPKQTLRRLFEENSIRAATQIIKLSASASSERIRLDASKYIVERVMGPMVTAGSAGVGGANGNEHEPGSLEHTLAGIAKNIAGATDTE